MSDEKDTQRTPSFSKGEKMDKKLRPYSNFKTALMLIPIGLVIAIVSFFLGETSEFFAELFAIGLFLPIIALPMALFYFIRSKINVLTYNSDGFKVGNKTYKYKDIINIGVSHALTKRNTINYSICVKEGYIYTYNNWYDNYDEFTRILEDKNVKFKH